MRIPTAHFNDVMDDLTRSRERILAHPWQLEAYARWRNTQGSSSGGGILSIFGRDRVFSFRDDDFLASIPEWDVRDNPSGGAVVTTAQDELVIEAAPPQTLRRMLDRADGSRTAAEIAGTPSFMEEAPWVWLQALAGIALTSPKTVAALDDAVSRFAVVRFPTSPYAVKRNYWHNMADVWARRTELESQVADGTRFAQWLRELHLTAVMGAGLDSFYKPGSPIAAARVCPGAFDIGATWVGGDTMRSTYFPLLAGAYDDAVIFSDGHEEHADGVRWGTLRHLRTRRGRGPVWLPERPVTPAHLGSLAADLEGALHATQRDARVVKLARFHQHFVRLHPFACANQCLAMGLVNQVLYAKEEIVIPHVHLDFCALVLSPEAYADVFGRALAAYGCRPDDASAGPRLIEMRDRAVAFVRTLLECKSPGEALERIHADPENARLVLLAKPPT